MFRFRRNPVYLLVVASALLLVFPAIAGAQASSSNSSVTTVVTALGPDYSAAPKITQSDVSVYSAKSKLSVTGWEAAADGHGKLQLAILIDNAVNPTALGLQMKDLRSFIEQQSADTQVGIFYAQYGTFATAAKFSVDHQEVAKKLRLPLGRRGGASPSIYLSLSDLAKKWPGEGAVRREVLLISSGMDLLEPGVQDPYFDSAVSDVQKHGVVVNSIYVGPLRLGLSFFGMIAQGNLGQITGDSGGDAFFQGVSTPVSFKPFLDQLNTILRNQYVLTLDPPPSVKKGHLFPIDVRVEQKDVKLLYPRRLAAPAK